MKRLCLLLLILACQLQAHDARPVYVEITETAENLFEVQWKAPATIRHVNVPEIILEGCKPRGPVLKTNSADAYVRRRTFHAPAGFSGGRVVIRYPMAAASNPSLIRVRLLSGEAHTRFLESGEATWTIPKREARWQVAREYTVLGIRHILAGVDHLLFVVCLLLVAGTGRRMLLTITGFTIAHSITLALSALSLVHVPVPPVEATIALSIVFLATEIAGKKRDTWTYRYPIAVSGTFGLLHGFGFAAVLREIGLPQIELPAALLFFNVGVELGQLLFVGAVLSLIWLFARLLPRADASAPGVWERLEKPLAYGVGIIAMYWTAERVMSFWI